MPQLIEFKLSTVLHGSNTVAKPVFADSPAIGEVYVPKRLKRVLEKVEKGENKECAEEESEEEQQDYVIEERERPKEKKRERRTEREAFVPMNVFDLEEQAK